MDHSLNLNARKLLNINGVEDVISFDENGIILKTSSGILSIDGGALHIVKMSVETGDIIVEGQIDGLFYQQSSDNEKRSFMSRIFK